MSSRNSRSEKILSRLREQLKIRTDTELANFLEIRQNTLSGWKARDSADLILIISQCEKSGRVIDWDFVIDGVTGRVADGMQPYSPATKARGGTIPLFLVPAPAGSTSPADDHVEQVIDVRDLALPFEGKCFGCRVVGDSMEGAGIDSGDIVIVHERSDPMPGDVVVCTVDSELCIKRFERIGGRVFLYPDSPRHQPIEIRDGMTLVIWGVAVRLIKPLSNTTLTVP